ncbi:hypothetical protein M378DRAFT_805446 [Amanita muscaria Koide BX008]|uniref:Uncharacterized protein n=1 Tax=Amanita muscaria (strain Koide BX008) TaxID=946122 RepID=A0A0C2WKP7_AMAMK|nr:hypothetical protein M378DRAFT_805446 [Amanita muscaria Koide BX008]
MNFSYAAFIPALLKVFKPILFKLILYTPCLYHGPRSSQTTEKSCLVAQSKLRNIHPAGLRLLRNAEGTCWLGRQPQLKRSNDTYHKWSYDFGRCLSWWHWCVTFTPESRAFDVQEGKYTRFVSRSNSMPRNLARTAKTPIHRSMDSDKRSSIVEKARGTTEFFHYPH